ncbi:MAG: ATP-binding protein [Candidatus Aenigmatarchaeota archaeon]
MGEIFYKRKLEDKIMKFLERREIIGIRGPRQAGKTTLLKMIEKKIEGNKAFINLDLIEYRKALEENPLDFVKRFKRSEEKLFLFLDEIQKVKDGGEKLKIIYDEFQDVKIFISGSSSLELKANILPHLVGRLFLFDLLTFCFEEFLSVKDEGLKKLFVEKNTSLKRFLTENDEVAPPSFTQEFLKYWKEYVVFGGYPEVVKAISEEEKITILKNIFNLYLEKDVVNFFRIEETSKFEDLVKILAFNTSNLLSLSSLSNNLKISFRKIEDFLNILHHSYIVRTLFPFHKNLTTELRKTPKIYFLDLGLRNSAIDNFLPFDSRTDKGALLENFIFIELFSTFEFQKLNYWRTTGKAEIDFVLSIKEQLIPIEVKLTEEKLGKSFHSFLNAYKPEKAIIVTLDKFKKEKVNNTIVYWVPVFYF